MFAGSSNEHRLERSTQQCCTVRMMPKVPVQPNPAPDDPAPSASEAPEAMQMQLGLMCPSLTPEERQCRQNNLCLYCGEAVHYVRACPAKLRKCLHVAFTVQQHILLQSREQGLSVFL